MGAGKGKSRRSLSVSAPAAQKVEAVTLQRETWKNFVKSSGLENTNLYDYYLGAGNRQASDAAQYEKIVTELFSDAVSVGAILLPEPYQADDFRFKMAPGLSRIDLHFADKSKPVANTGCFWYPFSQGNTLGHNNLVYALSCMESALSLLLSKQP